MAASAAHVSGTDLARVKWWDAGEGTILIATDARPHSLQVSHFDDITAESPMDGRSMTP